MYLSFFVIFSLLCILPSFFFMIGNYSFFRFLSSNYSIFVSISQGQTIMWYCPWCFYSYCVVIFLLRNYISITYFYFYYVFYNTWSCYPYIYRHIYSSIVVVVNFVVIVVDSLHVTSSCVIINKDWTHVCVKHI